MPKRFNYDDDIHRLPTGVKRTGYDATTQTYTYSDAEGRAYAGSPGATYGVLRPIDTEVRYFRERAAAAEAASRRSSSSAGSEDRSATSSPMLTFPDTWDAPPEVDRSTQLAARCRAVLARGRAMSLALAAEAGSAATVAAREWKAEALSTERPRAMSMATERSAK